MGSSVRPLAIVTGGSSGIGLELARVMDGEGDVVAGLKNKLQTAMASVTPAAVLAERHRKMAEPGSGDKPRN